MNTRVAPLMLAGAVLSACSGNPTAPAASKLNADLAAGTAATTQTYFVCPTVAQNNPHGMWVIGGHGGYNVIVPHQGATGSKVYLTVPVQVFSVAQIPAGWGLYSSLPTYPNFEGTATILSEGITRWLSDSPLFHEGDMVSVVNLGNGTYSVTVVGSMMTPEDIGNSVTIDHPIPLASGAIW